MDRNTAFAFALSMLVFAGYTMYQTERRAEYALEQEALKAQEAAAVAEAGATPGEGMEGTTGAIEAPTDSPAPAATTSPVPAPPAPQAIPARTSTLRNGNVIAKISNGPALIESWVLQDFFERLPEGDRPIELLSEDLPVFTTDVAGLPGANFENVRFEVVIESDREVVQRATNSAGVLTRTIRLDPEGYGFDLDLSFENRRSAPVDAGFQVAIPARVSTRPDFRQQSVLAHTRDDEVERYLIQGFGSSGFLGFGGTGLVEPVEVSAGWAGFDAQFFAGLVIDASGRERFEVQFEAIDPGKSARAVATLPALSIGPGGSAREKLRGFLGPKTEAALAGENADLQASVDRGWSWLEPLTRFFELALDWLYKIIPNYGWAIIILTILVRLVTSPLMVRQMRSAERMREVQPKLKALQERYADDRQKQSEEMMKLYREEKINPLGGCLPLILQMPVLIGLFYALRTSIGLRHAPWILWFDDLSQPATMFEAFGFPVRLLPLIMAGSMYLQQKMMPQTGMDPVQARMMQIMMPGMMLLFSYTFPSGLVIYWTVSNLLGIVHQYWVRNHLQKA